MNPVNQLLTSGEVAMLNCGHGDTFMLMSGDNGGQTFQARLDIEAPLLPEGLPLGDDPRNASYLRCLPSLLVSQLQRDDIVKKADSGTLWKLVQRENNDAAVTVDFLVEQQI